MDNVDNLVYKSTFPTKTENENVDNFHRTDVLKRVSLGENGKKLCILSKKESVRGKE